MSWYSCLKTWTIIHIIVKLRKHGCNQLWRWSNRIALSSLQSVNIKWFQNCQGFSTESMQQLRRLPMKVLLEISRLLFYRLSPTSPNINYSVLLFMFILVGGGSERWLRFILYITDSTKSMLRPNIPLQRKQEPLSTSNSLNSTMVWPKVPKNASTLFSSVSAILF